MQDKESMVAEEARSFSERVAMRRNRLSLAKVFSMR